MRLILLPLALIVAGHAHAQDRATPRKVTAEQVGDALSNPQVQNGIAGLVSAFADVILDTKIGPVAPYSDSVRPEDSLGDLVRREDPRFDQNLQRDTRRAIGVARDGVAMGTELGKTADRLQALIEGTTALIKAQARAN